MLIWKCNYMRAGRTKIKMRGGGGGGGGGYWVGVL